jgi:hypothetical protein
LLGSLGGLLGVACALVVPLAWPQVSMAVQLFAAGAFSLLPLALADLLRHGSGRSARVWGLPFLGTIAEDPSFAARLAQANASRARRLWLPPIVYRVVFWTLPAACVGLAAASHVWHHPRLHVANTSAGWLWVEVDGLPRVGVPAAPRGGVSHGSARLPQGRRRFVVRDERGQLVADTWAALEGGREHLFTPGAVEHCFWLETTGYGKDASFVVAPLASASRFYTLDIEIDSWFGEGSEPSSGDRRSSGGTLTALHQAPCTRAPIAVRRAASAIGP